MRLIFSPHAGGKLYSVRTRSMQFYALCASLITVVTGSLVMLGYLFGVQFGHQALLADWKHDVENYSENIRTIQTRSTAELDALTTKVALMQSHIDRLDALGNKLVAMADLQDAEFDFSQQPGLGGPESEAGQLANESIGVEVALQRMAVELRDREDQLLILDGMLANRNLRQEIYPQGRPVTKGWISSYFGKRSDPFTGAQEFHKGVDIAGKLGSDVVAVAGGVVTNAGDRNGYGNLVEIDHGNGYVTRYGHNSALTVKVGQAVKKGQTIAKMGSTGRSTGPHVHFEVLKNGQRVNPMKFIQASR